MTLRKYVLHSLVLAAALNWNPVAGLAEEKDAAAGAKSEKPAPDSDEMMKKLAEFATPGPAHKALDVFVGEWEVEATLWMGGPGSEPSKSKGTSKSQWLFDGRYLQQEFSGEMMGQPFKGMGHTGYDNFKKKYFSTWMDSMGTGFYLSEGTVDGSGKVFTFLGKMDEPMTGEKDKPTKTVLRIVSPDKHIFEMHDLTLGEKSKVMELTYTRKR